MKNFFTSPHPVGEMILGSVFVVMGIMLAPFQNPSRHPNSFIAQLPPGVIIILMSIGGGVLSLQGLGTLMKQKRSR